MREDVQDLEVLPLVFVDPFDQNVEERFVVHVNTGSQFDQCRQVSLVRELYVTPLLLKRLVIRQWLQTSQLVEVEQPPFANGPGDKTGERTIADCYEASGGHAVGHVTELPGPQLSELVHHRLREEIGMQPSDTVDAMAADRREVGHAHEALAGFIDERHPGQSSTVAGERSSNFIEKASVDFVDDLQMTGKELTNQIDGPFLKCLRKERVVGVGKRVAGNVPRRVQVHPVFVH